MKLVTKHFGEIEIEPTKVIDFKDGLPGFPDLRKFVLLSEPDEKEAEDGLFYWLQSVDEPYTAFVMVNMVKYMPSYNPLVEASQMAGLGPYNPDHFFIYNIAVLPEDLSKATVNLMAPVVINDELKQGKQVICSNSDEYTARHYLFQ